ncbi:MAG: LysM peptidoglycan-binding domain-containing protein, partial [Oscillospiraceae bacterium]|nr:LysM peptidoglycan-binding domain-containing protein [Oscillospiraceae bacterium]
TQKNGGQAIANLSLVVNGIIIEKTEATVVEDMLCENPYAPVENNIALRIYYADAGETIFDIAKRYHACPQDIAALAGVDTPVLAQPQKLLIPMAQ